MLSRTARGSCAAAAVALLVALSSQFSSASSHQEGWKQLNLSSHPSARTNPAMTYDPVGKNIVLFGGYDGISHLNDTWIFNGKSWVQLRPAVSPSARSASAMAYDVVTKKIVMFGGFSGSQYLGDTWIWDGAARIWTQATPATQPTPVTLPMVFTDPLNGHAEMVGGYDGQFYQLITWQWTGSDWKKRHPANNITARGAAVVGNDPLHHNVVIFGGLADVNPVNTWTWDGNNWTEQSPSNQPPWSFYTPAAYDPRLGEVVMFGGSSGLNQTWAWNGSDWTLLSPVYSPIAEDSQGMAYDWTSRQMIMFGGENGNTLLDSTWELIVK